MLEEERRKKAAFAVERLKLLEQAHCKFIEAIPNYDEEPTAGQLSAAAFEVQIVCLGRAISTIRRPVAISGVPVAMEYRFVCGKDDTLISLATWYLGLGDAFYRDAHQGEAILQLKNPYLKAMLLDELACALLDSDIFAPQFP